MMNWCDKSARKPLLSSEDRRGSRERYRGQNNNNQTTADVELKHTVRSLNGDGQLTSDSDDEEFDQSGVMEGQGKGSTFLLIGQKTGLLLWKNLLFRRRHYIVTALEVILPTLMALLIAYIRTEVPSTNSIGAIHIDNYEDFPLVSEQDSLDHAGRILSGGRHEADISSTRSLLAYTPDIPQTLSIMLKVKGYLGINATFELKGFRSEKEIEIYMAQSSIKTINGSTEPEVKVRAVIVFEDTNTLSSPSTGATIPYKIRLVDVYEMLNTDALFPLFQQPGPDLNNLVNYQNSGFTGIQIAMDKALIYILTKSEPTHTINTQGFPYPPHTKSVNWNIFIVILPRFMVLGFIFLVPSVIRNVVSEKETGIKELMKMMGLPNWMHWLGWMLNSLLLFSVSITIVIILLFVTFDSEAGPVLVNGDPTLWWVVFFLFAMASTAFFFLVSTFFQRPTLATTFGIVIYLVAYFAPVESLEPKYQFLSLTQKLIPAFLPNVALHWAIKVMCGFEGKSVGARWSNLFDSVSSVDELCVGYLCLMLILDTILFMTLTVYFENVIPSEYGLRKPWYYIFQLSRFRRPKSSSRVSLVVHDRSGFESEPSDLNPGVVIQNLRKQFGRNKVAVNMSGVLKMYDGQITALLGHNGAGKTTTLSILTGLFSPTSGTATVNGYDIGKDMDKVRMNLGLCPQHNMLFAKLTVEEHLIFFGRLKGLSNSEVKVELKNLLQKLHLSDKTKTLAEALSGGQKRKLCLGMALIGGTKVVILDEPTSGMDPEARRAIWDLLLGMRGERTIILTTHFMEEADVLGDRIAIMAEGEVKCCGSPNFLKKYYGAGYTLKMTVADPELVPNILELVKNIIPDASLKESQSRNNFEIDITIPSEREGSRNCEFPGLFAALNDAKERLGIETIGLSLATMDDIFIKVGHESGVEETQTGFPKDEVEIRDDIAIKNGSKPTDKLYEGHRLTGLKLQLQQFNGMFCKRMLSTLRKRKLCISQFLMPIAILIVCILLSNSSFSPDHSAPPLTMDLTDYKNPVTFFETSAQEIGNAYKTTIGKSAVAVENVTGALLEVGNRDLGAYREKYILAGDLNSSSVTALFSTIPIHASPLSVNLMSNTILRSINPSKGFKIQVTAHPLQSGLHTLLDAANPNPVFASVVPVLFGVLLPIGLALLAASFIVSPVEEKLCKAKQLQLMTGVSPTVFWGASFLWDFCLMFILICVMLICFPIFQNYGVFTAYNGAGVMFLILILYGFSAISFSYVCSTFVATVPGGFSLVTIIHILTGIILSLTVYMLEAFGLSDKVATPRIIGRFFPTYGASVAIMRFTSIATRNSRCNILSDDIKNLICRPYVDVQPGQRQCCPNCADFVNPHGPSCFQPESFLKWTMDVSDSFTPEVKSMPGIGQDLLYLFLIGLLYKVILMVIEYGLIQRLVAMIFKSNPSLFAKNNSEDEDVLLEKQRAAALVSTGRMEEDALVVENLCKSYGSFAAVSGLSFGVHHGECFGLLGVNGAGKTTSFRMLTGDEFRSFGNAFSMGLNLERNRSRFLSLIGYCPQFDGIIGVLTGKEMVDLFGRLRGIPPGQVGAESNKWLTKLGLHESANVQCQKYSGGMKRRLCAAIALVGDSPIILLDEPTSGVDPIARRQFWKVIDSVRHSGQAVVLTSHSMEECEALCSRLGIMVNGQFQCMGGVQHLKAKFAQGFRLVITLTDASQEELINTLSAQIIQSFNPCFLKDKHQRMLEFQAVGQGLGWGQMFERMEEVRGVYAELIADYSITETTLEEVFLSFARMQYPEREVNISCFKKCITCQCCN